MKSKSRLAWPGIAALALGALLYPRKARGQSFRSKTALITGGSRGLGFILARLLAEEGARVAICSRNREELARAESKLRRWAGENVLSKPCDVTDARQVASFVEAVAASFGGIDLVINNAGVIQVGPLEAMTHGDFLHSMDVTFTGTLNVTTAALPWLERSKGRIMNITSIGGAVAVPHLAPYVAAKHAVVGLSESLSIELRRRGISVTTVVPGLMRTGSYGNALFKGKRQSEYNLFALGASLPLLSMDAERAAARMIEAARSRRPYIVVGLPARLARLVYQLFPGRALALLAQIDRLLPSADRSQAFEPARKGFDQETRLTRSRVVGLSRKAAKKFNEREESG